MSSNSSVPQPPLKPIVGNLAELQGGTPIQSMMGLARSYGAFFKLTILDRDFYVASSASRERDRLLSPRRRAERSCGRADPGRNQDRARGAPSQGP
jgi:hypothetical protein